MHHRSPTFARTSAVCVVDVANSAFCDTNGLDRDLREVLEEGRVAYLLGYYRVTAPGTASITTSKLG